MNGQTTLEETLTCFTRIRDKEWFPEASVIVILTNPEAFAVKLQHTPLSNYYPEFDDRLGSGYGIKFVSRMFERQISHRTYPDLKRVCYIHVAESDDSSLRNYVANAIEGAASLQNNSDKLGYAPTSPIVDQRLMSPGLTKKTMRSSMRQSAEPEPLTLRPQPRQQRSSPIFDRRSKNKSAPPQSKPMTQKIISRFANSDDEDGGGPRTFRSRFEDSSDDEPASEAEHVTYGRLVRGIPRKADDGDSTELEDSSDE